jgi:hypothetical protein
MGVQSTLMGGELSGVISDTLVAIVILQQTGMIHSCGLNSKRQTASELTVPADVSASWDRLVVSDS